MFRSICVTAVLGLCGVMPVSGQGDPSSLEGYFTGKMVVAKIDMPGSEKGVDLAFNKPTPLDWKDYSSRLTAFGVAIHKGDAARVTKIVLKSDHIEFHLDGGGYGVAGDDTNTTVAPVVTPKSDREKDLVKQVAAAKDPKQKQDLQDDLDRERARRARQDAANKNAAMIASQMKAQQVAEKRLRGRLAVQSEMEGFDSIRREEPGCGDEAAGGLCGLRRIACEWSGCHCLRLRPRWLRSRMLRGRLM